MNNVKAKFAATVHKRILPEIDRAFHELISDSIEYHNNPKLEIQRSAEWLKPVISSYIDDQLHHCIPESIDQPEQEEANGKVDFDTKRQLEKQVELLSKLSEENTMTAQERLSIALAIKDIAIWLK